MPLNDKPMYEKFQQVLNSGIIYEEKRGICRYSIINAEGVINIIKLIKGKFCTPKIIALHKALDNIKKWRG